MWPALCQPMKAAAPQRELGLAKAKQFTDFYTPATATALTFDAVNIGNPGNPNDSTGYGTVATTYAIGKYEVTLNQYSEFLNAVADTDDYGLYNPSMETDLNIKGITRSGSSGSYTYVVNGDGQRPVTYVSWFDSARFMNWLHNGQPNTGSQTASTTEDGLTRCSGRRAGQVSAETGWRSIGSQVKTNVITPARISSKILHAAAA